MKATIDFETFSEAPLSDCGAWAYSEHPSTDILCLGYKLDLGPTKVWVPADIAVDYLPPLDAPESPYEIVTGPEIPEDLLWYVEENAILEAHNARFEQAVWFNILHKDYGYPMPKRWRDTMAVCAYRSLPMKLKDVGRVLCLTTQKMDEGKALLNKVSKPRKPTKKDPSTRNRDPLLLHKTYIYCGNDVDTEHELSDKIGQLPDGELEVWVYDQIMNNTGIYVDKEAIEAATQIVNEIETNLNAEIKQITKGEVCKGTEVAKIKTFCSKEGINLIDLTAETVDNVVKRKGVPPVAKRVLEIRQQLGKSSTSKLNRFKLSQGKDGKIRDTTQYHGAGTGRWAGRGIQPHNFPRGSVINCREFRPGKSDKTWFDMDLAIEHIKTRDVANLEMVYGNPMGCVSSALRGLIIPSPGKRLYVADFAAIEARVVMWLAQSWEAVDAFYAYDRGEGEDIYCVMASKMYGFLVIKAEHSEERGHGKVVILGCGYGMGPDKLRAQAEQQGIILTQEQAEEFVKVYREEYEEVPQLWYGLEDAAVSAIETGKPHSFCGIVYNVENDSAGRWLTCRLPSGRKLWYFRPKLEHVKTPWGAMKWQVTYEGKDNKRGGIWGYIRTYGGMLTENVVQAIARDIMWAAMKRCKAAGYPCVLTVHDELVAETDIDFGSVKEFEALVTGPSPKWADRCPIAAEAWTGLRYKKG